MLLALVGGTTYDDTTAEPGLQYWYTVSPVVNSVPCEPGKTSTGYRKVELPQSKDLDRLIREKTKPVRVFKDEGEKQKAAAYTALLKGYYKNPVELSIILNIIKSYVKKGAITVLTDFNQYSINIERREIIMIDEGYRFAVLFTSSRLIRILLESQMKSPDPENKMELTDMLVKNMTAFCVYLDERSITDTDNRMRVTPNVPSSGSFHGALQE